MSFELHSFMASKAESIALASAVKIEKALWMGPERLFWAASCFVDGSKKSMFFCSKENLYRNFYPGDFKEDIVQFLCGNGAKYAEINGKNTIFHCDQCQRDAWTTFY